MKKEELLNKLQEVDEWFWNNYNQIMDNPFYKKKVTWIERLFGIKESETDYMIRKLKAYKHDRLRALLDFYIRK